ncbi:MAG: hypothetical protein ABSC03_02935 [Verrucomicrobiota bacterium]
MDALHRQRFDEAVHASRFEHVADHGERQVAGPVGLAALLELLQVRRDVVRANLVQMQVPDALAPAAQVTGFRHQCIRLLAECRQARQAGLLQVFSESRTLSDVPQPVLASFDQQLAELVLGFGHGLGLQGHPFDRLAAAVVFDGDPGDEAPVAPPQAANCVLAVIENLGVSVSA